MVHATKEVVEGEWVTFPGGELEGKRPKALCPSCRARVSGLAHGPRAASHELRAASREPRPLCFQCYRVDLERQRALQAAGQLDTASEERFQEALPFLPVDRARLHRLKAERAEARQIMHAGVGRYVDKRRHAQIAARHALQRIGAGLARDAGGSIASPWVCRRAPADTSRARTPECRRHSRRRAAAPRRMAAVRGVQIGLRAKG
jgi:hypothetical protein